MPSPDVDLHEPPNPSPNGLGPSGVLTFLQPDPEETTIPAPASSPESSSPPPAAGEAVAGSPSDSGWSSDEPGESLPETSWPESSADDPGRSPITKKALKATIRRSVITSASVAHKYGARTPGQQQVGLYLVDEDDVEGISDPLASIAHRRGGLAGKLSPDHADGIAALMAFGGYVAKQFHNIQTAKELDGQAPAEGVEQ